MAAEVLQERCLIEALRVLAIYNLLLERTSCLRRWVLGVLKRVECRADFAAFTITIKRDVSVLVDDEVEERAVWNGDIALVHRELDLDWVARELAKFKGVFGPTVINQASCVDGCGELGSDVGNGGAGVLKGVVGMVRLVLIVVG